MSRYLILRDRRLRGGVPARPHVGIINTDASTPIRKAFHVINAAARSEQIHSLFILCHGYAGENERAEVSIDAGGMGLQLGREDLLHSNVAKWGAIRGKVRNIVVYACAAADTEAGNAGTDADGRYLMGALALSTDATVFAADRIQWFSTYQDLRNGRYDFGQWEGHLLRFLPTGESAEEVAGPPVDLSVVLPGLDH
jgi:hypothetical protein